jgi:hypothetical protein
MIMLKQMLQLMIRTVMYSLKVFLKNLTNKIPGHKKKDWFFKKTLLISRKRIFKFWKRD